MAEGHEGHRKFAYGPGSGYRYIRPPTGDIGDFITELPERDMDDVGVPATDHELRGKGTFPLRVDDEYRPFAMENPEKDALIALLNDLAERLGLVEAKLAKMGGESC